MRFITVRWRSLLLLSAAALAVSACLVAGCGGGDKPSGLVGHWVFAAGYADSKVPRKSIEMFKDGNGVVDGASMTWKVENKRLMMLTSVSGTVCDYKVSGDGLVITYDNGKSATFMESGKLEEYKKKIEAERTSYFTDSRDDKKYRAVKIGGKVWMAENLNYKAASGSSYCYDNNNSNCEKYGRLYYWETAKKACPSGWHLPTRGEWNELVEAVGGGDAAGMALKSVSGWNGDGSGVDSYGFSALPGGLVMNRAGGLGEHGAWWSASSGAVAYFQLMPLA